MKLSRRGKYAMHTRRGKHTKRAVKHYTRRIKHRCKQYKRTYRKNKKRTRCRSLRGGSDSWTASVLIPVENVTLTYKKQVGFTRTVTDTYAVTVQKEVKPNDNTLPIKYTITLKRITRKPNIQFEINIIPSNTMQFAINSYDTQKKADPVTATEDATAAAEDAAKTGVNYMGGSNDNEKLRIEFRIDYDGKPSDEKFNTSAHTYASDGNTYAFVYASDGNTYAFVYASLFNIQSDRMEGYDFDNDDKYQEFMKNIL